MAEPKQSELFTNFILSLHMSALLHMGKIMSPLTAKVERNMPRAKEAIDFLSVIEEKTRGNLHPDEARLMQRLLFEMRMNYVEELETKEPETKEPESGAPHSGGEGPAA